MKTYKYKIAKFKPDGNVFWYKEHFVEAEDRNSAIKLIHDIHKKCGYLAGIDYEFVYVVEV